MRARSFTSGDQQLIEAKARGEELVAPPAVGPSQLSNLMEALQKGLDQSKKQRPRAKPPKQVAPGTAAKAGAVKRKREA